MLHLRALVLMALAAAVPLAGCASPDEVEAAAALALGLACGDASVAADQGDTFSYGGAVGCKTANETYTWENAALRGHVAWAGAASEGSLDGRVLDAAGREVYAFHIDAVETKGVDGPTAYGVPANPASGPWTIELSFERFSGSMGLAIRSEQG